MAEYIFNSLLEEDEEFYAESAAVSSEEIGNPVYPPAKAMLRSHGIDCSKKRARKIRPSDYEDFDYIIGMDESNMRRLRSFFAPDNEGKVIKLLSRDVDDPWYTDDFETAYEDIYEGVEALLYELRAR